MGAFIAPFIFAISVFAAKTDMVDVSGNNADLSTSELVNMRNSYGVKALTVKISEGSTYAWKSSSHTQGAAQTIANAQAAGLYVNGYHFGNFTTLSKARAEANWAVQNAQADGLKVGSVLALDFENQAATKNSISENDKNIAAFQEIIQAAGFRTDIYLPGSWVNKYVSVQSSTGWIASYPKTVTTDLYMQNNGWQFSSIVQFVGVNGHFDVTQLYTNYYTAGTDKNAVISDSATTNVTKVTKKKTHTGIAVDGVWIVNNSKVSTETTLALQKIYNMK